MGMGTGARPGSRPPPGVVLGLGVPSPVRPAPGSALGPRDAASPTALGPPPPPPPPPPLGLPPRAAVSWDGRPPRVAAVARGRSAGNLLPRLLPRPRRGASEAPC